MAPRQTKESIKARCSKVWGKIRPKAADAHSVVPESPSRDNLPSHIPPTVSHVEPEPHELAAQQPSPAQTTPESSNPGFPGRLWTDAYDSIKQENSKLVQLYEEILRRELGDETSTTTIGEPEADQTNVNPAQMQMIRLVETAWKKTEKEAAATDKIQEGIRIGTSIKDVVGTALEHAHEAAAAWGGVCLLLQVRYPFKYRYFLTVTATGECARRSKCSS